MPNDIEAFPSEAEVKRRLRRLLQKLALDAEADRAFLRLHPDRTHRARPATVTEWKAQSLLRVGYDVDPEHMRVAVVRKIDDDRCERVFVLVDLIEGDASEEGARSLFARATPIGDDWMASIPATLLYRDEARWQAGEPTVRYRFKRR